MARRIILGEGGDRRVLAQSLAGDEAELHTLIKEHPELIPVDDLGLGGPLLVVGNETSVQSGLVDLVCVARGGEIVIVEFKTGPDNGDFRRVLAQLIDYGAHLWGMDLAQFDQTVVERFLKIPLRTAMTRQWDSLAEQERDEALNVATRRLKQGDFVYIVAAQRFTETVTRGIEYLNAVTNSSFYGVELVRFGEHPDVAYEARVVAQPSATTSPVTFSINADLFLSRCVDAGYRNAMESFINLLPEIGYRLEWGAAGFSIRVKTPLRSEPISLGWAFPPAISGWGGLQNVTLGIETRFLEMFPAATGKFERYAERALNRIPGARASTATEKWLLGVHLNPSVVQKHLPTIREILAETAMELTSTDA